jgi:membrane protein implicated in regulation of membrane protease activity
MAWLLSLSARLRLWLAVAGAAVAAVLAAYLMGRRDQSTSDAGQRAQAYNETRKEIDNADLGIGATDQQRIDRLREIADRRR